MGRRARQVAVAFVDRQLPLVWGYVAGMLGVTARAHEVTRSVVGAVDPRLLDEDDEEALRRLLLVRARRAVHDEGADPDRPHDHAPEGTAPGAGEARGGPAPPPSLSAGFAGLGATEREALLLLDVLDVGLEAAAAVCDTSPARLQQRRHRAHTHLVERLLGSGR